MDGETETKPVIAEGEDGAGAAPVKSLKRRNRPGTKNADMYNWEPLAVSQLEGPLAVEEYLQQLIRMPPFHYAHSYPVFNLLSFIQSAPL
jgi:hypothetical protein